jgi:hypothetical protein
MELCTRCKRFDIQSFSKGAFFRTYNLSEVVNAEANGCIFCRLLLESLQATMIDSLTLEDTSGLIASRKVFFWVKQAESNVGGLGITHLCATVLKDQDDIFNSVRHIVSFHVAADPG